MSIHPMCNARSWSAHTSSIPPTPHFCLSDPYPTSALSLPRRIIAKLSQFVAVSGTQALMHSHQGLANLMRGGHVALILGGLTSSARASPRLHWSLCASLTRSPRPSWSDQWRTGQALGRSGCGGSRNWSRFFSPESFARHAQGTKPSRHNSLQFTEAWVHVHDHGVPAA